MNFWEKVKRDIQKGIQEGIDFVKEGATVVKEKAEELTEEGKKQYKIFEIKTKVQKEMAELGGRVYDLSSQVKNPFLDSKVKAIINRIKKFEAQITKLKGALKVASKKTATKRSTRSKNKKS
jgi:archaellum component FlaC